MGKEAARSSRTRELIRTIPDTRATELIGFESGHEASYDPWLLRKCSGDFREMFKKFPISFLAIPRKCPGNVGGMSKKF